MNYSAAAADQPLPKPGKKSVNAYLVKRFGGERQAGRFIVRDIQERAAKAQAKYNLEKPGLYTFNGRSMLQDFYQEILDSIVYLAGIEMECTETGEGMPIHEYVMNNLIVLAVRCRTELILQGADIRDDELFLE